jgi:hypothetical protein
MDEGNMQVKCWQENHTEGDFSVDVKVIIAFILYKKFWEELFAYFHFTTY